MVITDWKGNIYGDWNAYAEVFGHDIAEAARKNMEFCEAHNKHVAETYTPLELAERELHDLEGMDRWRPADRERYAKLQATISRLRKR